MYKQKYLEKVNISRHKSIFLANRVPFQSNNFKHLQTKIKWEEVSSLKFLLMYVEAFPITHKWELGQLQTAYLFMFYCVAQWHYYLASGKSGRPHPRICIWTRFHWGSYIGINIKVRPLWTVLPEKSNQYRRRNILPPNKRVKSQFSFFQLIARCPTQSIKQIAL